jgi:hypothetical protein
MRCGLKLIWLPPLPTMIGSNGLYEKETRIAKKIQPIAKRRNSARHRGAKGLI